MIARILMKALVAVKRVIDYTVKIRVKSDFSGVEKKNLKMSMNPFCEIAVEEALRMKEKGIVSSVSSLSIGDKKASETVRHSLNMGADEGHHVLTDYDIDTNLQPLAVSKILAHYVKEHNFNLVLLGKQAIDDDCNHVPQMLSSMLNWPLAPFASEIEHQDDALIITRETDTGLQKVKATGPVVISCDLRLNTPRYIGLKNITQGKKKKIHTTDIKDLGIDFEPRVKVGKVTEPEKKQGGCVFVEDVDALLDKLKNEAKVI